MSIFDVMREIQVQRDIEALRQTWRIMATLLALISSGCAVQWNSTPLALAAVTFAILRK